MVGGGMEGWPFVEKVRADITRLQAAAPARQASDCTIVLEVAQRISFDFARICR